MNIGLVSIYDFGYPGGVNLHVANLAEQFSKEGHRVRIIAPCSKNTDQFGTDKLIPLGWSIPLHTAGTTARIVLSMRLANKVKPLLERENFDLIHYHEPLCPTLPTTILRNSKAVNVATFHAFHGTRRVVGVSCSDRAYTIFNSYVRKHWLSRLHAKIAVSQAALEFVSNHFPGDYTIIPNGIDLERFHPHVKPIEQFDDGYVNILFVGRMEKRKGLKYLLSAYSKLKWDYPKIRLLIVGPGNMDSDSERIMGERSLEHKDVKVIGNVSHDELPPLLPDRRYLLFTCNRQGELRHRAVGRYGLQGGGCSVKHHWLCRCHERRRTGLPRAAERRCGVGIGASPAHRRQ